jgi:hypothetical protein
MLAPLNNQERQHIASLRAHPLLANLAFLHWDDLLALLLQRRFLSLSIVVRIQGSRQPAVNFGSAEPLTTA